jgi:ribosomal protein S20
VATHKSAEKRMRSIEKRKARNRMFISKVKTAVSKFKAAAIERKESELLHKLFKDAQSVLACAGSKGILHSNNTSRRIGRLSLMLKKALEAAPMEAAPKKKVSAKKKAAATATHAKPTAAKTVKTSAEKPAAKKTVKKKTEK